MGTERSKVFVTEDGYTFRWNGEVWTDGDMDANGTLESGPLDCWGEPLPSREQALAQVRAYEDEHAGRFDAYANDWKGKA